ncbi:hypothetical protein FYJ86_08080 [Corynebacterium urealyticum]|nr:hypothetical protein FYJ86_08080 [Corynebacterium urealyticum]
MLWRWGGLTGHGGAKILWGMWQWGIIVGNHHNAETWWVNLQQAFHVDWGLVNVLDHAFVLLERK